MASDIDIDKLASAIAERVVSRLHTEADRLLDRAELAQRLGVAERTVGSMVSRAQLPAPLLCTGGLARWSWSTVLAYLSNHTTKPRRGRGRWNRNGGPHESGESEETEAPSAG